MKKYRQTRITVKTREIISFSSNEASGNADGFQDSICPLCHSRVLPPAALLTTTCGEAAKEIIANEAAEHDCPK